VNESYSVTVPAAVRRAADVQSGDKIRWYVDEDGALSVELVKEQYGVFSRLEPVDIGDSSGGGARLAGRRRRARERVRGMNESPVGDE
jgi:bifunctional DNA-binding transcriptional regulator/antitoxin component of YhaV-PrlF toxin-antitoxin module